MGRAYVRADGSADTATRLEIAGRLYESAGLFRAATCR